MLNKELTPGYLLEVVRRRILSISLPAVAITLLAVLYALSLQNIYMSETLILVEPRQTVQNAAGRPSLTVLMERDGLSTISQQILSRSRLETIINEYQLYGQTSMELRVRDMREAIQLDLVRLDNSGNVGGFKLSYQHPDARITAEVTNRLAGLFIEENVTAREQLMGERLKFLEEQEAQAKGKLNEQEQQLQQFKSQYIERLPDQRDKNLRLVEQANMQLAANNDALNRAQHQRVYLEAMIAQYQSAQPTAKSTASREPVLKAEPTPIEKQVAEMREHLADLRNRYTQDHPDVIKTAARLSELEQQRAKELSVVIAAVPDKVESSDTQPKENFATLAQLTSQLQSIKSEIAERNTDHNRLQGQLNLYQARLEMPPSVEQELTRFNSEYSAAKANYEAIANEKLSAQMAQELEQQQKSMLFRILDPARQPEKPFKPNRRKIAIFGLMLGLATGLGLAFYREFSDESMHTEKDVEQALGLEVLAAISKI